MLYEYYQLNMHMKKYEKIQIRLVYFRVSYTVLKSGTELNRGSRTIQIKLLRFVFKTLTFIYLCLLYSVSLHSARIHGGVQLKPGRVKTIEQQNSKSA